MPRQAMATRHRRYSCDTAAQTLEWMNAIADFLRPYKPLLDAHVVNFFKDSLWETVDKQWMECLRGETVENLLNIPSGFVQDYWPASLREFILTLRSLVLPREPKLSHPALPDLHVASLGSVLAQGMNLKKKHEVEILAAVVKTIANGAGSETIIDVGAGQGYLAQALSFQYQLSVIAIDASLHHSTVTSTRAERIKKHYAAKMEKSEGNQHLKVPQTVTCHVLSSDTLTALSPSCSNQSIGLSLVLAGLHACGDLSVNMLRSFVDCEQVKAVVSIGCCYNLLSEEGLEKTHSPCGFPMSNAAKLSAFVLGKNGRDLACQSAERWRSLTKDAAHQNFEIHAYRAAFQMVLDRFFPEVLTSSPSIGRQGKALRRQQIRRARESRLGAEGSSVFSYFTLKDECRMKACSLTMKSGEGEVIDGHYSDAALKDDPSTVHSQSMYSSDVGFKQAQSFERSDKGMLFKEFSKSGLDRLGLGHSHDVDFLEIWKEAQHFSEFIGPFWSLRAALGPLVETYIFLDRLLFLQEQGNSVEALLLPLFDPTLSPRNVAIIARKTDTDKLKI